VSEQLGEPILYALPKSEHAAGGAEGESNWSVGGGLWERGSDAANRAAINTQIALRRKYDLITESPRPCPPR
jgi:hypothetical protein